MGYKRILTKHCFCLIYLRVPNKDFIFRRSLESNSVGYNGVPVRPQSPLHASSRAASPSRIHRFSQDLTTSCPSFNTFRLLPISQENQIGGGYGEAPDASPSWHGSRGTGLSGLARGQELSPVPTILLLGPEGLEKVGFLLLGPN